jgi:hypothetical protein
MQRSPNQNINEERDYKSDKYLSAGETVVSEAENDEKLDTVLCATERVGTHQLSVTEAAATPKGSSDAEEGRAEMHIEEATLQTQDPYVFMLTLILVTG